MKRKKLQFKIVHAVFERSRRRCCLCFGLNLDAKEKDGQIAHIDRNAKNDRLENLVYLCLDHHNRYDSIPSLTKRITPAELKKHRRKLDVFLRQELARHKISGFLLPETLDFIRDNISPSYKEAIDYYCGTHRSRSVVLLLEEGPKNIEQINSSIPPCDIDWTKTIVGDVRRSGWIRRAGELYYLSKRGKTMLAAFRQIPEELREALWNSAWRPF